MLCFSDLIDRNGLLFNWRWHIFHQRFSSLAASARCGTLTDTVNHKSYSKLWQRLCVHSSVNMCQLWLRAIPLKYLLSYGCCHGAGKHECLPTPSPHSCLFNTDCAHCNTLLKAKLLIHSLPAHRQQFSKKENSPNSAKLNSLKFTNEFLFHNHNCGVHRGTKKVRGRLTDCHPCALYL